VLTLAFLVKGILGASKVMMESSVELIEKHDLHPVIKVFAWKDAAAAFEAMRSQEFVGKIVIEVD